MSVITYSKAVPQVPSSLVSSIPTPVKALIVVSGAAIGAFVVNEHKSVGALVAGGMALLGVAAV